MNVKLTLTWDEGLSLSEAAFAGKIAKKEEKGLKGVGFMKTAIKLADILKLGKILGLFKGKIIRFLNKIINKEIFYAVVADLKFGNLKNNEAEVCLTLIHINYLDIINKIIDVSMVKSDLVSNIVSVLEDDRNTLVAKVVEVLDENKKAKIAECVVNEYKAMLCTKITELFSAYGAQIQVENIEVIK